MLRLSCDEAAKALGTSVSTLDRWIKGGTVESEVVMVGQQRRVTVLLPEVEEDGRFPVAAAAPLGIDAELALVQEQSMDLRSDLKVANERVRGLEDLVDTLREQVVFERSRYAEIYHDVRPMLEAPRKLERPWWRLWQR